MYDNIIALCTYPRDDFSSVVIHIFLGVNLLLFVSFFVIVVIVVIIIIIIINSQRYNMYTINQCIITVRAPLLMIIYWHITCAKTLKHAYYTHTDTISQYTLSLRIKYGLLEYKYINILHIVFPYVITLFFFFFCQEQTHTRVFILFHFFFVTF